jgi:hypothetical protein
MNSEMTKVGDLPRDASSVWRCNMELTVGAGKVEHCMNSIQALQS